LAMAMGSWPSYAADILMDVVGLLLFWVVVELSLCWFRKSR
jgi:hypothetical protein